MRVLALLLVALLVAGCTAAPTKLGRLSTCDPSAAVDENATPPACDAPVDEPVSTTITITSSPTPVTVEGTAGSGDAGELVATPTSPEATPTPEPTPEAPTPEPTPTPPTQPEAPANETAPPAPEPGPAPLAPLDVLAFSVDAPTARNGGAHAFVFRGVLAVPPAGAQMALDVGAIHGAISTGALGVLPASEPERFDAQGAKVWAGPSPETASFAMRLGVPRGTTVGETPATLVVGDDAGRTATAAPLTLTILPYRELEVGSRPVGMDGRASSAGWGGWRAQAGAARVTGLNFLRIANTGEDPNATVTIRFPANGFVGLADPSWSIPVAANVEFAPIEKTESGVRPTLADLRWTPAADDGSVTISFHGAGHVLFVAYRILQMPAILPAQDYAASYSIAEGPA